MRWHKLAILCAVSTAALSISPVHAQENGTDKADASQEQSERGGIEHEIVVVGKLTGVAIDREELDFLQANDLRDIFRKVPSVSVGGSLGIAQKIYVRGLEDSQINVTIDGAPQSGTLFHHIGRVNIEPELLETVELQAGAGEATAGFGAIGGALRFRTRDASDLLEPGRNFGGIVKAGWFSNDGYKLSATLYTKLIGDVGIVGSYVYSDRDEFKDGDGNNLRGTAAEQQLGFVKIGGDIGSGHSFSVSYEHRDEEGEFGARPNWPVLAGDTLFPAEATRQTIIGNYGYDSSDVISLEAIGYWTRAKFTLDRSDRWGLYGADIESYGFDARFRAQFSGHDIIFGAEHRSDSVASEYLADAAMWQPWAWDPNIGRFEETGDLFGVYLQDHWQIADPLLLSFGVRYDAYDLDVVTYDTGTKSDGLSFNIGADLEVLPGLTLNAGYAEAFRGKEIGDAFTLEHRPGRDILQPGLKPETVGNFEVGAAFERDGFTASAAYFDMKIKDVILDQLYRGPFPQDGVYYENIGDFTSEGIELRAAYRTGPFGISGFYNHYDSRINGNRINGYEQIALGNTMGDNWNLTASFDPSPSLGFEASLTRFEAVRDLEVLFRDAELGFVPATDLIDKPGYTVVDLFARWQPFDDGRLSLNAAVYNLFDKQYIAHASVGDYSGIPGYEIVSGLAEPGRNFRLTASYRF
ncbi:TonB-dependent receptor domain-containing protein [Parasphingorhabdus cellanae]|uniref:TonB-dependent receptor n=1 Tax=Parasphingorhabdus cellanae TaxID=2806553 RepID=A0ABX7T103_9SPHN|nr:TonB-dependent receptor [Parasphingorhabdus cellanae]QTD54455.1 TonB-dependent receptor [Parasphingorhabdus cellanae]